MVIIAAQAGDTKSQDAFAHLYRSYWYPLFGYLRGKGFGTQAAEDLLQAFFLHISEKQTLARADRLQGPFRAFVLGCLRYFLANQRELEGALKRGGGTVIVSIDADAAESRLANDLPCGELEDVDHAFDRRWAAVIMEESLDELGSAYSDRSRVFQELKGFLTATDETPYAEVAARLEISVPLVKTTVHRMRKQFREIIRRHIAATVSAPHEIDGELRYLIRVLASE
jgi:RNA polymerase sigma-70 factor (ECF subfamily)